MPDRQYPEPTREQLEWMESATPILKCGDRQQKTKAYIVQPCIDIRPAGRIYAGQAIDRDMSRVWDRSFIEEMFRVMMVYPASDPRQPVQQPYLNWKAISKFRYKWLRPYLATAPGGLFSAELHSSLMTVAVHASGLELEAIVELEHDNCAAADSTKLSLIEASQLTLASLHRWTVKLEQWGLKTLPMAENVMVLVGSVKTEGTELTRLEELTSYNRERYEHELAGSRTWQVSPPNSRERWISLLDPEMDPIVEKYRILDERLKGIIKALV